MCYKTMKNPQWLQWIAPDKFCDEELFRIVVFFVFHSPCSSISYMSRSLMEYGWSNPWSKPYYLNKQLKQAATKYDLLYSSDSYKSMEKNLEKAGLKDGFPQPPFEECICVYDNMKNQFMSVFYHIRNSFAHGRLNMVDVNGECIFLLEDVQPSKNVSQLKVSARMILRKSTLLKWIDIVEGGEKEYIKA